MSFDQRNSSFKIVALAGRRTDALDTDVARFPLSSVDAVRTKLHDLFLTSHATKLVSSAACGADLVALDVAGELAIERHIIIPFSIADFRRISVTDRPGDWGPLYDRVIADVSAHGHLQILGRDTDDDSAFSVANKAIIKQAKSLAIDAVPPLAVVVWEGQSQEPIDATREFADLATAAGFNISTVKSN